MRTLVTGASGFVGTYCMEILEGLAFEGAVDLRDRAQVEEAVAQVRPDAVIHLAAQSSLAASFADPVTTQEVNFLGTLNLLLALEQIDFRGKMLFVSSGDCYGIVDEAALPIRETQPLHPRNPYSVSKVAAEALCYQWSQTHDFQIVVARPFNQTGPRQSPDFVVADIGKQCSAVRRGVRPSEVTLGDYEVTRDFTDVRDAVRAFALLLEHGRNAEAYNVCSGHERPIQEIVDMYARIIGTPISIRQDSARLRRSEQRRMRGSFEKLHAHTGWKPVIPLEKTLTDILNYWDIKELE